MAPIDATWHLLDFFGAALGVGLLSAGIAKLLWRRELTGVPLARLAAWSSGAGAVVSLGGLAFFGRDGRMGTYGAMALACALVLWWRGFGPGRP